MKTRCCVSYNAPFLLTLNSQLSNCSFFRVANQCKNGGKFKSCVNFGTLFTRIYIYIYIHVHVYMYMCIFISIYIYLLYFLRCTFILCSLIIKDKDYIDIYLLFVYIITLYKLNNLIKEVNI